MSKKLEELIRNTPDVPKEIVVRSFRGFNEAETFEDIQRLMLEFFQNRLILPSYTVLYQQEGIDSIPVEYTEDLITMNSNGFITTLSQDGMKTDGKLQRMYVDPKGLAITTNYDQGKHREMMKAGGMEEYFELLAEWGNKKLVKTLKNDRYYSVFCVDTVWGRNNILFNAVCRVLLGIRHKYK